MSESFFPLCWESTGNRWWFASPIDWAAANGHYDLVRELLRLDPNLLIKLTSLRRIRRIETLWDDDPRFVEAARSRSFVARNLLLECESRGSENNALIRAGYGGWLLYIAASAGDVEFVQELIERDPLLVFGEGEYGVSDILYAAARSKERKVFKIIFERTTTIRPWVGGAGGIEEGLGRGSSGTSVFHWEIKNRAVLAAAMGGNLELLKELLGERSDVLAYRDGQGATILHVASARGQAEVVNGIVTSFDIIDSRDDQGNTALHVAAFWGHLQVIEALVSASSSLSCLQNNDGETFLHMVIMGFHTPGFRRLDHQMELMRQLISGNILNIQEVINIPNNDGRSALHMAVISTIQSELVELLMTVPSIDVNIQDIHGMTPLDLLNSRPPCPSLKIMIKRFVSAGGTSNPKNMINRSVFPSMPKMQFGLRNNPGTSFRITDSEIFLYTGIQASEGEIEYDIEKMKFSKAVDNAVKRIKYLLRWLHQREKKTDDDESTYLVKNLSKRDDTPIPLRQTFSKGKTSLLNTKRIIALRNSTPPSPVTRRKLASVLASSEPQTPVRSFSYSQFSSPVSENHKGAFACRDTSVGT
ncbi:Ankyrin repeat-containing protein [Apostasia shenzhenica]|uniref:Ankyrin repeat-containing protein n=1 Tax=Apostasia shenzhenica TaxID=1088818 RepID=A0A2I0AIY7_9ASPA|nr:Ankyrin repeat-containing protein [Apostasia shenzhenica]